MTKKVLLSMLSVLLSVTMYTPVNAEGQAPATEDPGTTVQEPEAPEEAAEKEEEAPAEPAAPAEDGNKEEPETSETIEEPGVVEEAPQEQEEPAAEENKEGTEEAAEEQENEPVITTITPDPVTFDGVTVTVSYPSDTFGDKEVTLIVGEPGEKEKEALEALGQNFKAVDISFADADGNKVQPAEGKNVSVVLKAEGMEAAEDYKVVHVDAEGVVTELTAETSTSNEVTETVKTGERTKTIEVPAETETVTVEDYEEETYTDYETVEKTIEVPAEIGYRTVRKSREVEKVTISSGINRVLRVLGKRPTSAEKKVIEYYYEEEPYEITPAHTETITETVPVTKTRNVLVGTHEETKVIKEAYSYEETEDVFEDITTNDVETSFSAASFSVYAVVDKDVTAEESRLTVNFISNGTTIGTMYVKNKDKTTAGAIETIIYDPGVGTLTERQVFTGWTTEENYGVHSEHYDIEEVRNYIAGMDDWKEGDVLNLYAKILKTYSVTYKGPKGVSLGSDAVMLPLNATKVDYQIHTNYEPELDTELFKGWNPIEGSSNITDYTSGTLYPLNSGIEISGDVVFSTEVATGHWLVFDQNGKGATYNAPRFYTADEPTSDAGLLPMQRYGYTFGGWYTDKECTAGNEYNFNELLEDHRTIYAKWTPVATANYTVIIWKQNVNDAKNAADSAKTYDFAESVRLSGPVNTVINTVTANGQGNNRYATVNGLPKQYTGFHLNKFDTNVTITPEGTAIVNVYYDRNLVTLTFLSDPYSWFGTTYWATQSTMTGLYGSSITGNGYTWPTNRWWYDDYGTWGGYHGAGTRTTFLDAFLLSDGGSDKTFYGFTGSGNRTVHFLKKNSDNNDYTEINTAGANGGNNAVFYITDKYNGYKAVSYSRDNRNWTTLGNKDSDGVYAEVTVGNQDIYVRYDPLLYNIVYMDGVYVDGNNNPVPGESSRGQLNEVDGIPFDSSVASYNKGNADYYEPTYAGFVFEGWYIDDACTHEFTFTNMPEGIKVYAKWRQVQYRVFLHPNVPNTDTTLNWGSDDQDMNFRVSNGAKVSLPTGTRDEYTFIGWYTDEGTHNVYPEDTELYDDTPYLNDDYDKTRDFTDPMDKYGEGATTNNDVNRPWITKKLDLYGKWSAVLIGADGIGVKYDANGGSNAPSDTTLYKDNVDAVAQGASTAPAGKQFECWMVQHWDGTKYADTTKYVYPGDTFTVLKSDAQVDEKEGSTVANPQYTYTVQLKAVYVDLQAPTPTHITWYANGGTLNNALEDDEDYDVTRGSVTTSYINLQINQKVPAAPADTFKREGYKFVGWAKVTEPTGAFNPDTHTVDETKYSEEPSAKLWLKLNDDGETYTEVGTDHTHVTEVAADENAPYHAVYAVWEVDHFFIFHSATGDLEAVEYTDKIDLTSKVTSGYLYGGYYKAYGAYTVTDADKANAEKSGTVNVTDKTYDPATNADHVGRWTAGNAYTVAGTEMEPEVQKVYYLKEVPASYLRPTYMTTYQRYDKYLRDFILMSTTDDNNYSETGFMIGSNYEKSEFFTDSLEIKFGPNWEPETVTDGKVTVNVTTASDNVGGYVFTKRIFSVDESTKDYSGILGSKVYKLYWKTFDGITVTGASMRVFTVKDKDGDRIIKVVPVELPDGTTASEITCKDYSTAIKAQKRGD